MKVRRAAEVTPRWLLRLSRHPSWRSSRLCVIRVGVTPLRRAELGPPQNESSFPAKPLVHFACAHTLVRESVIGSTFSKEGPF